MINPQLDKLKKRITRANTRLNEKEGKGAGWTCILPEGDKLSYSIKNVKPLEDLEDEFSHMIQDVCSLKDHIKKAIKSIGKDPKIVEEYVSKNSALQLCLDLANSEKHGHSSRHTKSGHSPQIGKISYKIPQQAIESIFLGIGNVEIDVATPEIAEIDIPITSHTGKSLGDGIKILQDSMSAWESFLEQHSL